MDQMLDVDKAMDALVLRLTHPGLIDDCIDRRNAEVPDTFVPSATLVAVANNNLLSLVHPKALGEARQMRLDRPERIMAIRRPSANGFVLVARRYGELWGIERQREFDDIHEALVFDNGAIPVFHRKPHGAIALAKFCHPNPRKEAQCLRWVPIGSVRAAEEF